MNKVISSTANPKVKELIAILNNQSSSSEEYFLIEGFHLVEMAKKASQLVEVFSIKPYDFPECTIITSNVLNRITSTKTPQGVVGLCKKIKTSLNPETETVFYLDGIQDPGNIGTILRTLLALGFSTVALSSSCASIYNPKTILASQGSIFGFHVSVLTAENLVIFAKKNKFSIITTELDDKAESYERLVDMKGKMILVLGSEGSGVSKYIRINKTSAVYIPIMSIDSLNVGVACGIIANTLRKRKWLMNNGCCLKSYN